ncbi:hypothetical protein D3C81_934170 [compost metagenome]
MSDVDATDIHAAAADTAQQDLVEKYVAKAHRQEHVRGDQAEGHHTGHQAPVDLQLGQHIQQRRHQQRNEGDMDRQDVLRRNCHHQQQADQQPFDLAAVAVPLPVDHGQGTISQGMGHARLGDGHGEGAEQSIGQRHRGTATQPAVEGLERAFDAQAADQPTRQGTHDQGNHHMHAGQAQYQHDADRGNYCIHSVTSRNQTKSDRSGDRLLGSSGRTTGIFMEGAHSEADPRACQKNGISRLRQSVASVTENDAFQLNV